MVFVSLNVTPLLRFLFFNSALIDMFLFCSFCPAPLHIYNADKKLFSSRKLVGARFLQSYTMAGELTLNIFWMISTKIFQALSFFLSLFK